MKFKEMDLEMWMLFLGAFLLTIGTFSTIALITSGSWFWIISMFFATIGFILIKIDWKDSQSNEETKKE